jgi:hypothetical protein
VAKGRDLIRTWIGGYEDETGKQIDKLIRDSQCRWSVAALSAEDAERIVACVNFCRNVPLESMKAGLGVFVQASLELNDCLITPEVAKAIKTLKDARV